jgi:hypothetical protein
VIGEGVIKGGNGIAGCTVLLYLSRQLMLVVVATTSTLGLLSSAPCGNA